LGWSLVCDGREVLARTGSAAPAVDEAARAATPPVLRVTAPGGGGSYLLDPATCALAPASASTPR
jgi:hypothetical protein